MPAEKPKRIVARRKPPPDISEAAAEYLIQRSARDRAAFYENKLKAALMQILKEEGEVIKTANSYKQVLSIPPTTFHSYKDGQVVPKTVVGVERRVRNQFTLNEDTARAFLARKKLLAQCVETIEVLSEDLILALNYRKQITDKELEALYDKSEIPAFYLTEGD